MVLTAALVLGSLVLISYSVNRANAAIKLQNVIAAQNKQHIDCIIKDLATPQQPGTNHKFISDLSSQCNIKFTQ